MAIKRVKKVKPVGLSEDTKTVVVIVTLLLAYPVGLILTWLWMKWPAWVKVILALPVILGLLFILTLVVLSLGVANYLH